MTAKEKAEELIDKFYQTTPNEAWYNPPLASISMDYKAWEQAKQCALIAVDELIKYVKPDPSFPGYNEWFWQEVKQEIERL